MPVYVLSLHDSFLSSYRLYIFFFIHLMSSYSSATCSIIMFFFANSFIHIVKNNTLSLSLSELCHAAWRPAVREHVVRLLLQRWSGGEGLHPPGHRQCPHAPAGSVWVKSLSYVYSYDLCCFTLLSLFFSSRFWLHSFKVLHQTILRSPPRPLLEHSALYYFLSNYVISSWHNMQNG